MAPPASSPFVRKTMQANKSKNTSPELRLRKALREAGLVGYRLHTSLPGTPDVTYTRRRLAIFVHGCYWHRCPVCVGERLPKRNVEFWREKFRRNAERHARAEAELAALGFKTLVVWECQIRRGDDIATVVKRMMGV